MTEVLVTRTLEYATDLVVICALAGGLQAARRGRSPRRNMMMCDSRVATKWRAAAPAGTARDATD